LGGYVLTPLEPIPCRTKALNLVPCLYCSEVAPLPGPEKWAGRRRYPLDDLYIWSLVWQQRKQIFAALGALLVCVASNLASPVISGALFETLVQGQPFSK